MSEMTFGDLLVQKDGLIKGPFGGDIKKSLFVPKDIDTYKVYEQGVVLNHDINRGDYYVSKEYFEKKLKRFEVKENDILLTGAGTLGELFVVPSNAPKGVINQALLRVRLNKDVVDQNFFCYYFKYYIKAIIGNINGDSVIPNLPPLPLIKSTIIDIPEISYQQKIAAVLSALDAKIELNQRINAELESMAKTLYDYWFVQFDFPNEKGKPYKSAGGKMIWNEALKREIPLEWEVGFIEQICERINSGGTPSTKRKEFYDGVIPWYATNELQDKFLLGSNKSISRQALDESSAKIFPSGTIVIAIYAAPTVGRLGILTKESAFNQACCGIIANEKIVSTEYMFLSLLSMRKLFNTIASGTAQKNLSVGQIKNLNILIPSEKINLTVKHITKSLFEMIERNQKESQTLTELRDWLLPMLMNGQVKATG